MYCQNCGAEIDNSAAFCPRCGAKQQQKSWYGTGSGEAYGSAEPRESYQAKQKPGENVLAIIGFSLACLSLLYGGAIIAIVGLVLAIIGIKQIGGKKGVDRTLGIIGIVVASVVIVWNVFILVLSFSLLGDIFGDIWDIVDYSVGGYM